MKLDRPDFLAFDLSIVCELADFVGPRGYDYETLT